MEYMYVYIDTMDTVVTAYTVVTEDTMVTMDTVYTKVIVVTVYTVVSEYIQPQYLTLSLSTEFQLPLCSLILAPTALLMWDMSSQ